MPEVYFEIEWPDGERMRCYSPSTIVREYFRAGMVLTIEALIEHSEQAFTKAGERVREKCGFVCTSAVRQLAEIQERARSFRSEDPARIVTIT